MAKKRQFIGKKKKKIWIRVFAPKEFKNAELGKTRSYDSESTIGRKIKCNYSTLIGDSKRQQVELGFRIVKSSEGQADTEVYEYKIWQSYLKRAIKKTRTKIDDSFECLTKDKVKVKIKPFIIIKNIIHKSLQTEIRKKMKESLIKTCQDITFTEMVQELIKYNIQKDIKNIIKKLAPIGNLEIRHFIQIKA